jgi:UDP-N-acetylglucosamine diphosphorylase / glucose-1-phosphate thymidylyltransferase / UDP-N-acetylgalactosamine diphosphorylase / glucosamine-1-phosphate N-acetyltransferase / galactosamine-1-phosphate N-acetyltransferase
LTALYLLEPPHPRPDWIPFAGVRPVAELRAGVWKIRERWEAALDLETSAILGDHIAQFHEGFEPACRALGPVDGPALIVASWFAPTGAPIALGPATRRLTSGGATVGWVVPSGQRWTGPGDAGEAQPIDGLLLRGSWDLLAALDHYLANDCLGFQAGPRDPVPAGAIVLGDPTLILTHQAQVEPGVVFDTRHGAIVLEAGVEVRHGTRLEGPLYAGARSRLLGDHLRFSSIGPRCNVKGEVSNTIFTGYSNKGHDGFVGHTVLGHWVNLGAGTTTSNLKNTYGEVALELAGTRVKTGRQFLGSLIGDHAKTAIGTMLPTGTVIGAGASVFGSGSVPKEVPPFAWGTDGSERLHLEGFLTIAERVMPRRDVAFTPERRAALSAMWKGLAGG